jgi:glycosyltransferase involved in cell wall biosynthesis
MSSGLDGRRIVLDCRWLGLGGAGTVTELLLGELRGTPAPGTWVLWGKPERTEPLRPAGAELAPWSGDPRALAGQRDILRVPHGDVVLYGHQIRPLRPGRSVTVIHDTIPLRHGGTAASRRLKRAFLRGAARLSRRVLTDSEFSRECIERDLGVHRDRISVMTFPPDAQRSARVARLRDELGQEERLLYLGRFAPHKNLERLSLAFAGTAFAARGGTLLLVGGWDDETEHMRAWVAEQGLRGIEVRPACADEEVDRLLATSRALVLPSLEEGFGLPAYEAAASGLPVAASRTGAMASLSADDAVLFDPLSTDAIRAALDEAVGRPPHAPWPAQAGFAGVVLAALEAALTDPRGREPSA